jgi:hypothetical protein
VRVCACNGLASHPHTQHRPQQTLAAASTHPNARHATPSDAPSVAPASSVEVEIVTRTTDRNGALIEVPVPLELILERMRRLGHETEGMHEEAVAEIRQGGGIDYVGRCSATTGAPAPRHSRRRSS